MTFKGIDLSPLLQVLSSLVLALIGWATASIQKKQAADAAKTKAETALLKLAAIGAAMVTDAWQTLAPAVQARVADGNFSAQDRAEIEAMVKGLLDKYTSSEEIQKITEALGLPLAGIIAKIAAYIIDKVTAAHDPDLPDTASPAAFPVAERAGLPAGVAPGFTDAS